MPRGGKREGTPGKGYANRTDLINNYSNEGSAATAGVAAPAQQQPYIPTPLIGADQVANLTDPTQRPGEPVTAGIPHGPGPGMEALGPMPPRPVDPVRQNIEAMMLVSPNPDLMRLLNQLDYEGR